MQMRVEIIFSVINNVGNNFDDENVGRYTKLSTLSTELSTPNLAEMLIIGRIMLIDDAADRLSGEIFAVE